MKTLYKYIAALLIVPTTLLFIPGSAFSAGKKKITRHSPQIMATAEKEIGPDGLPGSGTKKKANWLLVGLGAVLVIGLLGGAAGGGGSDSGGGGGGGGDEGEITVGW